MTFFSLLTRMFHIHRSETQRETDEARRTKDFDTGLYDSYRSSQNSSSTQHSSRFPQVVVDGNETSGFNRLRKKSDPPQEQMPPPLPAPLIQGISEPASELPPPLPSFAIEIPPPLPSVLLPTASSQSRLEALWKQAFDACKKIISSDRQQQAETFFSKARYQITSMKKVSPTRDLLVLRPAEAAEEWHLWKFPFKKTASEKEKKIYELESTPLLLDDHSRPLSPSNKTRLMVGVPTRDLIVIPLWIASEGNIHELIELELASKHLLRRGMAEGLKTIPLETKEGRTLVIVLAPTITASAATAPYLNYADQFEAAARLLPLQGADLLLWRELGEICFGFSKNNHCVWFSGSSETSINATVVGLIKRMALRLQAESVLERMPRAVRLIGLFSEEERSLLKDAVGIKTEEEAQNNFDYLSILPPPLLPTPSLDLPDERARTERLHQEKKLRLKRIATLASLVYLFLLILAGGSLLIKKSTLNHLRHQIAISKPVIDQANQTILQWQEFRAAMDPTAYALDILATITRQIHGEKIRLITLACVDGRVIMAGEATDVAQAYHFIEQLKKDPDLQEYQWTSGQPKLAGKNSVRFELEGSRPNAKTSTE